jgi:hypothetical protein
MTNFCETCGSDLNCFFCGAPKLKMHWPTGHNTYVCSACDPTQITKINQLWIDKAKMDATYQAMHDGGFA